MAKILRLRRGNTAAHSTFTGKLAEVTVDTTKNTIVVHDNVTVGGHPLATESYVNNQVSNIIAGNLNFGDIDISANEISTVNVNQDLILRPNGTGNTVVTSNLHIESDIGLRLGSNDQLSIRYRDGDGNPWDRVSITTAVTSDANIGILLSSKTSDYIFLNPQTGNIGINTFNPGHKLTVIGDIKANSQIAESDYSGGFKFEGPDVSGLTGIFHINSNTDHSISIVHNGNTLMRADVNSYVTLSNLTVYGNNYVGGEAEFFGNAYFGSRTTFTALNANLQYAGEQNSYLQFVMQNKSNGASASTDIVATADNGTDGDTFIDMGINSSTYNAVGQGLMYPNDGYLLVVGNTTTGGGNLNISTILNNDIVFSTGGVDTVNEIARFAHGEGLRINGNITPGANVTYNLGAPGAEWNSLYVSGNTIYIGGVPLSVDNAGNLIVNGNTVSGGGGAISVGTGLGPSIANVTEIFFTGQIEDLGGGIVGVNSTIQDYLELTNDPFIFNPYVAPAVSFSKADYATGNAAVDQIDTNMAITRGNNQGIYNPYLESDWDDVNNDGPSPIGTLWNKDGWGDLTNLNTRIYLSFYETFLRYGNNVLAAEAVMYDVANNKYYKFDFTTWGNANSGAPVTYTRTQIDPVDGTEIGSPVTFTKNGYDDPLTVNDPIDTNLTLARANQYSIFNIAREPAYNSQGDGYNSPEGTLWNSDGWLNLRDVTARSYDTFLNVLGRVGRNIVGSELVMHDTINDKYYAIKFSAWTQNNNGGGFAYTRQQINTSQLFIKADYSNTVDIFVEDNGDGAGIGITRDNNNGIYNPYREGSWDETLSPGGTLWNTEGWDDLSDIETRNYQPFFAAFGNGGLGYKVPGTKTIMYIPETGEYYAIQWLTWTQGGNGGGFSYVRYKINLSQVRQGIKFADGTILTSAEGIGRIKSKASAGRRIEEVSGSKTVSVTAITTTNLTTTASRGGSNTQQIWIDSTETSIDEILDNPGNYNNAYGFEFSLDNSTWYPWNGSTSFISNERGYSIYPAAVTYTQGDTVYFRYKTGGEPVVWWDSADLPGGSADFRGAVIDYHAYTGQATWIGTIHIVDDSGQEHISHSEVSSGSTDSENDDLWLVQNEGTISYRRQDGESKTLKIHWTAKVFYGEEFYD